MPTTKPLYTLKHTSQTHNRFFFILSFFSFFLNQELVFHSVSTPGTLSLLFHLLLFPVFLSLSSTLLTYRVFHYNSITLTHRADSRLPFFFQMVCFILFSPLLVLANLRAAFFITHHQTPWGPTNVICGVCVCMCTVACLLFPSIFKQLYNHILQLHLKQKRSCWKRSKKIPGANRDTYIHSTLALSCTILYSKM